MNKSTVFLSLGALALLAGGCSKKLGNFQSDYFSMRPSPLETVGENVPGTVYATIPAKFMVKNAKVPATPVLQWADGTNGEVAAPPVI
ncbi:MAG: hypothetical protein K2I48_06720, partial [Muribaculaceae bacterium]|nr:hypothetical protein [Muribaculaceae bacterium]